MNVNMNSDSIYLMESVKLCTCLENKAKNISTWEGAFYQSE